jgi:hypothetical protein
MIAGQRQRRQKIFAEEVDNSFYQDVRKKKQKYTKTHKASYGANLEERTLNQKVFSVKRDLDKSLEFALENA